MSQKTRKSGKGTLIEPKKKIVSNLKMEDLGPVRNLLEARLNQIVSEEIEIPDGAVKIHDLDTDESLVRIEEVIRDLVDRKSVV